MVSTLTLLLVFQVIGEIIAYGFSLPVPGPVIGMALLFLALVIRGDVSERTRDSANRLLQHLSLLFIPAGVGVVLYLDLLSAEWRPLTLSLVGSTVIALVVTAVVMALVARRRA